MATIRGRSNSTTSTCPTEPEDSTLFSNRLIGLAISADSEISAKRSLAYKAKNTAKAAEARRLKAALNALDTISDVQALSREEIQIAIRKETKRTQSLRVHGKFRKPRSSGVTIRPFGNSSDADVEMSSSSRRGEDRNSGEFHSRKADNPNIITVFSSPCPNYFNIFKRNRCRSTGEVPEFVKGMMKKDSYLRKLVKSGAVTISSCEPMSETESEDSTEESEDSLGEENNLFEESQSSKDMNDDSKPYEPPADIGDWTEYPFAKKLLEFTHQSITVPEQNGNLATSRYIPSPSSNSHPGSSASSNRDSDLGHFSIPQASTAQSFRKKKQFVHPDVVPFSFESSQSKKRRRPVQINKTRNKIDALIGKSTYENEVPLTTDASGDSGAAYDSIDPSSFLEVSLQEITVPDDSHRRKYKCTQCSKAFCWSTDLKRHVLIHTGERPFKCTECPANFTRKFLMQKHLKKVHGLIEGVAPLRGISDTDPVSSSVKSEIKVEEVEEEMFKYDEGDLEGEDEDEGGGAPEDQYSMTEALSEEDDGSGGDLEERANTSSCYESEDIKMESHEDVVYSGDETADADECEITATTSSCYDSEDNGAEIDGELAYSGDETTDLDQTEPTATTTSYKSNDIKVEYEDELSNSSGDENTY